MTNAPIEDRLDRVDTLVSIINKAELEAAKERKEADLNKKKRAKQKLRSSPPAPQHDDEKKETTESTASVTSEVVPPATPTTKSAASSPSAAPAVDDDAKDEVKDGGSVSDRGNRWNRSDRNDPELSMGIKIHDKSIVTDALELKYPAITYMAAGQRRGDTREKRVSVGGPDFKWGGREGTKGFLHDTKPIVRWVIVDDVNSRGAGNKIYQHWEAYCGMRAFDFNNGPIREPQCISVDFRGGGDDEYLSIAQKAYELIFVVLPDGVFGSEIKAKFTKALQTQKMMGGPNKKGAMVCSVIFLCDGTLWGERGRKLIFECDSH